MQQKYKTYVQQTNVAIHTDNFFYVEQQTKGKLQSSWYAQMKIIIWLNNQLHTHLNIF